MQNHLLLLGCGFTGSRVARLWANHGLPVTTIRSAQIDFTHSQAITRLREITPRGCVVLHSIPTLADAADARLLQALDGLAARVVYLSTTGVYGDAHLVDASTSIAPATPRAQARAATERAVQQGPWTSLILRPAAIYGPGRGVHAALRRGEFARFGDGSNYISRIHVDDLAAIAEAALLSPLEGAFPVADQLSCTSLEIAEYCARLLSLPLPDPTPITQAPETLRANRRVDGTAICQALGVTLRYPTYREGIPACLAEEG